MAEGLVYVGKILEMNDIPGADFIKCATVICGKGGKWRGVVKKMDFCVGDLCTVYLPDSLIPESDEMRFMEKHKWRVKMMKYKGAPSEVLIMPDELYYSGGTEIGRDITQEKGVTKYYKPISPHLQGLALGAFPSFMPKTDEPNYQSHGDLVDKLLGLPYYVTCKMDGSSTTAFRCNGIFGLCSRNLELVRNESNGYWKVAIQHNLEETLPDGIALQWETCGPGIQGNPAGFSKICGFAFSAYSIYEHRYLTLGELRKLCGRLNFPMVDIEEAKLNFTKENIEFLGEGKYPNGKEREGVVVRSQDNIDGKPISFKVINLNFEK